jgi:tRNA G18 (ribose-2'-O)-methylase SpoU
MQVVHVDRFDDPRFVDRDLYRIIGDDDQLRAQGLFVVEGRFVAERLIQRQARLVRSLLLNDAAYRALQSTCARLGDDVTAFVCETRHFEGFTGYNIHRGCLALAARPPQLAVEHVVADARTLVLIEEVANADNVGGIFRNAAAFGVDGVILSRGCADPLYRKTIRTSMGAVLTVPFVIASNDVAWPALIEEVHRRKVQIIALTPDASATDIDAFVSSSVHDGVALLVGAEGGGLTAESQAAADARVRIPIRADVDSLNVAVATGIALHRLAASRARA